ncbi:5-oxoprolinase subunit PxpA [Marinimicrobium agarilyticum]|uniref:5-oxoprolinase subunit PxpA n=1 Tax=Marinimicrobium agarilyticum TaxID=306546 RepID=UPI0004185305|nr:5-oxoprolinase subunit PxpA [Marinimicrobium agarilyticum]
MSPPSKRLLLNCDMGESFGPWRMGRDEEVMPLVDMANIACGFHASDAVTMTRTLLLARQAGVTVGAHPSYPDLVGFGRRSMQCTPLEIVSIVQYQMGALAGLARAQGLALGYVKPHGALYNDMMRDHDVLRAVLEAVATFDASLPLMVLARADNERVSDIAEEFGVKLLFEAFADRAYGEQGLLVPREQEGAVYSDRARILEQSLRLAEEGTLVTLSGSLLALAPDTLCVHGDNDESVRAVRAIRTALDRLYGAA